MEAKEIAKIMEVPKKMISTVTYGGSSRKLIGKWYRDVILPLERRIKNENK